MRARPVPRWPNPSPDASGPPDRLCTGAADAPGAPGAPDPPGALAPCAPGAPCAPCAPSAPGAPCAPCAPVRVPSPMTRSRSIRAMSRSKSASGAPAPSDERNGSSSSGRFPTASEKSYPQFLQRSLVSNPRYPHLGHFIRAGVQRKRARATGAAHQHAAGPRRGGADPPWECGRGRRAHRGVGRSPRTRAPGPGSTRRLALAARGLVSTGCCAPRLTALRTSARPPAQERRHPTPLR
jgi:hypothetical protein